MRPRFRDVDIPEIPVHEDPGEDDDEDPPWHPTWEGGGGGDVGEGGGGGSGAASESGGVGVVEDNRLRSRSETFPCDPYSAASSASTTVNGAWSSSSSSSETAWGHHHSHAATTTWGHAPTPAAIHVPITGSTESAGSGASCSTTRYGPEEWDRSDVGVCSSRMLWM